MVALVDRVGYGAEDPLVVVARYGSAPPAHVARGRSAAGDPVAVGTVAYTASLSKQVTAACAALLVRQGRLDIESSLARWLPELPTWAGAITVRHLVHHTSRLPDVLDFDELEGSRRDRTTDGVLRSLAHVDHLDSAPGTGFRYCNAGYVCLAVIIERAAGQPLPDFADEHVFGPLEMRDSRFWPGPAAHPPGAAPTDPQSPAALSLGDGGMWSTGPDLLRWCEALERDHLGISALLHAPGHLDDGTPLDYAWGIGVRTHAGQRVYRHGGLWAGVSVQLIRIPDRRCSIVIIALDDNEKRTTALAGAMVDSLTT